LLSGSHLNDVSNALQEGITSTLRDNLGLENLGNIDIRVTGNHFLVYLKLTQHCK